MAAMVSILGKLPALSIGVVPDRIGNLANCSGRTGRLSPSLAHARARLGGQSLQARVRAVTLTNYREIARLVGIDPFLMLGRAGLHPNALGDPENWVPGTRMISLLEDSAAQSNRDDFAILLGECRTFGSLGPVSLLLRHERTFGEIVSAAMEYRRLINELWQTVLRDNGHDAVLEWGFGPGLHSSQGINLMTTVAYRVLTEGAGCGFRPDCIHFKHSMPVNIATFRRVFRCSLEFDSPFDGMSFASASLNLANSYADPELVTHARRLLQLLPGIRSEESTTDRIRSAIPMLISNGQATIEGAAKYLGIPVRTLQRRLVRDGKPFSQILNETRRDLVARYLASSDQSITSVADLLGYSAQSSFTRWFISEFGMPPSKWRTTMRHRDAFHLGPPVADDPSMAI